MIKFTADIADFADYLRLHFPFLAHILTSLMLCAIPDICGEHLISSFEETRSDFNIFETHAIQKYCWTYWSKKTLD